MQKGLRPFIEQAYYKRRKEKFKEKYQKNNNGEVNEETIQEGSST